MSPEPTRRERILIATAHVIARRGLHAFAVKEVCAEAGVSAPLLYHHFPHRAALVRGALAYAAQRAPSANLLTRAEGRSGFDALAEALRAEFDDTDDVRELNLIWNEVAALPQDDAELHAELVGVTATWNQQVTIGVLRGLADGSLRTELPPEDTAEILTATVEGLSQRWLAGILTRAESIAALDALLEVFRGS